ncbi:MAG TPA: LD-carboxypeptidase [Cyclobacteriaceae bacterium]|nr:LD-carboxypeptidase [Cyclobacteriaceae bacterium]
MERPPFLQPGSLVGITAPARAIKQEYVDHAAKIIESWGFGVRLSSNVGKSHFQYAGNDEDRLQALQEMLDDHDIRAILCARGGYGTDRIVDQVSLDKFRGSPKWIIGFSDITSLLLKIHKSGFECIHGPMPISMDPSDQESLALLKGILTGETELQYQFPLHSLNVRGRSAGMIIGGNITLINDNTGTINEVDTKNKILFLEETDEYLYRIDRMMVQLKRTGKLQDLAGLIVGHMTKMKDDEIPFGKNAMEIIYEHVSGYGYPVCFGAPLGHDHPNFPIPVGRECVFRVTGEAVTLSFKK